MIVPDTIDPYLGYKALRIDPNMQLASPTYQVGWPARKRFEATCAYQGQGWNWTLVEGTPPPQMHFGPNSRSTYHHGYDPRYYQTTSFSSRGSAIFPGPKPDFEPPEGMYWDWQLVDHTPAGPNCSCGVYVVDHVARTAGYLHPDCVICEITLWGQVTLGDHGARGQYAYPTKLYVPDHLKEKAFTVAATYEIEAVPQTFVVGKRHGEFVSHPLRDHQADARVAAAFFLGVSATCMSIASLLNLLTDWWITPIIFIALSLVSLAICLVAFYDAFRKPA